VNEEAASLTGLKLAPPVAAGGGDQAAQAVGVGAVEPGVVALTVGTSGVVFATTPSALIEPEGRLHAFCHAVPGMWHFMGVMLSAAGSLQWYRDTLAPNMDFDELLKEAESIRRDVRVCNFFRIFQGNARLIQTLWRAARSLA